MIPALAAIGGLLVNAGVKVYRAYKETKAEEKLEAERQERLEDEKRERQERLEDEKRERRERLELEKQRQQEIIEMQKQRQQEIIEMQKQNKENEKKIIQAVMDDNLERVKDELATQIPNILTNKLNENLDKLEKDLKPKSLDDFATSIILYEFYCESLSDIMNKNIAKALDEGLNHINIMLIGQTGVGKSTLINVLLDLKGNNMAEEGKVGKAQTMLKSKYTSNMPLYLFDSRGVELEGYNIQQVLENTKKEINIGEKNPEEMVNCVWYCVCGTRFQDSEIDLIQQLKSTYKDAELPVIVVQTQSEEIDDIGIKTRLENIGYDTKSSFVQVLAREKIVGTKENPITVPSKGLDTLINLSAEKIQKSFNSIFFEVLRKKTTGEIYDQISTQINDKMMTITDQINKKINNLVNSDNQFSQKTILIDILEELIKIIAGQEVPIDKLKNAYEIEKINNEYENSFNVFFESFENEILDELKKEFYKSLDKEELNNRRRYAGVEQKGNKRSELINIYEEEILMQLKTVGWSSCYSKFLVAQINYIAKALMEKLQENLDTLLENYQFESTIEEKVGSKIALIKNKIINTFNQRKNKNKISSINYQNNNNNNNINIVNSLYQSNNNENIFGNMNYHEQKYLGQKTKLENDYLYPISNKKPKLNYIDLGETLLIQCDEDIIYLSSLDKDKDKEINIIFKVQNISNSFLEGPFYLTFDNNDYLVGNDLLIRKIVNEEIIYPIYLNNFKKGIITNLNFYIYKKDQDSIIILSNTLQIKVKMID